MRGIGGSAVRTCIFGGMTGSWNAKNTNSIRLRTGDGAKHPVEVTTAEPTLTPEEIERAAGERAREAERIRARREAGERARRAAAAQAREDSKHASADHAPAGWVPANRRTDYVDPFAKNSDPRRRKS